MDWEELVHVRDILDTQHGVDVYLMTVLHSMAMKNNSFCLIIPDIVKSHTHTHTYRNIFKTTYIRDAYKNTHTYTHTCTYIPSTH